MGNIFSELYENNKSFENLLIDRFSRFDYAIGKYLKERSKSFFENFIDEYLITDIKYDEKHGYKGIPKPILGYQINDNDLHNIATSDFGLIYFIIVDEVIVNIIKDNDSYDYNIITELFNVLTTSLDGMISCLSIIENELFCLKERPNRLDHLKELSFDRKREISDIFLEGVGTESFLISRPYQIEGYVQTIIKHNLSSPTLSHTILSWLYLVEGYLYSETIFDYKLSSSLFLDNSNKRRYYKKFKGFKALRSKLFRQEIGLEILFSLFKFSFIFSLFYLIINNKHIFSYFNINPDYQWIVTVFLLTLVYFSIKSKGAPDIFNDNPLTLRLELIELFRETQVYLHSESYHPEKLKSQLHNLELKKIVIPKSMYLILSGHIKKNELIKREIYLNVNIYYEKDFITSYKDNRIGSLDWLRRVYGDIEIIREKNKINWKFKDNDDLPELRWSDEVELSVSTKPDKSYWKITDGSDKKYNLRFKSEFTKIYSDYMFDGFIYFFGNLSVLPKSYSIILESVSKQIENEKHYFHKDAFLNILSDIGGLGYIRFQFDNDTGELFIVVGLNNEHFDKLGHSIFNGEIKELTLDVCGGAYISNRHEKDIYDDDLYTFIDLTTEENVFKITGITVKSSVN
jgi:hypothetical protein